MPLGALGLLQRHVEGVDLLVGRLVRCLALQVRWNAAIGEQVHHGSRHQLEGGVGIDELCHPPGSVVIGFDKLGIALPAQQLEGGI
ncbi:hypothetical protein D3C86_2000430 [compost metagenome]